MAIVIVKYFFPFFLTEKTDTINATSEISNPNTEKAPGTVLGARANNANAIASQPATMLISTTLTIELCSAATAAAEIVHCYRRLHERLAMPLFRQPAIFDVCGVQ